MLTPRAQALDSRAPSRNIDREDQRIGGGGGNLMPETSSKLRSAPFGAIALLAVATGLYVAVLANTIPAAGGGEARISQAYAAFSLTLWLWIVLAALLLEHRTIT
jgi:hypothetical protein